MTVHHCMSFTPIIAFIVEYKIINLQQADQLLLAAPGSDINMPKYLDYTAVGVDVL